MLMDECSGHGVDWTTVRAISTGEELPKTGALSRLPGGQLTKIYAATLDENRRISFLLTSEKVSDGAFLHVLRG